jgi:O-antigen ligase
MSVLQRVDPERDVLVRGARVLFSVSAFLVPLTAVRSVAGFTAGDGVLVVATVLCLLSLARPPGRVPVGVGVAVALAVLAATALAVSSPAPVLELAVGARLCMVWLVWTWVASVVLRTREQVAAAATAFVLGACLSSVVALGQLAGVDLRPYFLAAPDEGTTARFIGLGGHANGQGGCLAVALVLCLAAALARYRRVGALVATVLVSAGLLLTASITGILTAVVGLVVLLWRARSPRSALRGILGVSAAGLALVILRRAFPAVVTPFDRYESAIGVGGTSTVGQRMETIRFAWGRISESPFAGIGFGEGGGTYNGVTQAHNMLVLSWYQGGILLLLAVVVMSVTVLAVGARVRGDVGTALLAATVAAFFFAQTGPSLYDRFVWFPAVLLLAAAAAHRRDEDGRARAPDGGAHARAAGRRPVTARA